jgi:hypothetical protein
MASKSSSHRKLFRSLGKRLSYFSYSGMRCIGDTLKHEVWAERVITTQSFGVDKNPGFRRWHERSARYLMYTKFLRRSMVLGRTRELIEQPDWLLRKDMLPLPYCDSQAFDKTTNACENWSGSYIESTHCPRWVTGVYQFTFCGTWAKRPRSSFSYDKNDEYFESRSFKRTEWLFELLRRL